MRNAKQIGWMSYYPRWWHRDPCPRRSDEGDLQRRIPGVAEDNPARDAMVDLPPGLVKVTDSTRGADGGTAENSTAAAMEWLGGGDLLMEFAQGGWLRPRGQKGAGVCLLIPVDPAQVGEGQLPRRSCACMHGVAARDLWLVGEDDLTAWAHLSMTSVQCARGSGWRGWPTCQWLLKESRRARTSGLRAGPTRQRHNRDGPSACFSDCWAKSVVRGPIRFPSSFLYIFFLLSSLSNLNLKFEFHSICDFQLIFNSTIWTYYYGRILFIYLFCLVFSPLFSNSSFVPLG
jgi:hypothetical protein